MWLGGGQAAMSGGVRSWKSASWSPKPPTPKAAVPSVFRGGPPFMPVLGISPVVGAVVQLSHTFRSGDVQEAWQWLGGCPFKV